MAIARNPVVRHTLFAIGLISVALGIVGAFLPLLPTTPFMLLAAWCFIRSSPKMHAWLYRQPGIGPALIKWEQRRAIALRTKIIAIGTMIASLIVIWLRVEFTPVKIGVTALLTTVATFIVTRPHE